MSSSLGMSLSDNPSLSSSRDAPDTFFNPYEQQPRYKPVMRQTRGPEMMPMDRSGGETWEDYSRTSEHPRPTNNNEDVEMDEKEAGDDDPDIRDVIMSMPSFSFSDPHLDPRPPVPVHTIPKLGLDPLTGEKVDIVANAKAERVAEHLKRGVKLKDGHAFELGDDRPSSPRRKRAKIRNPSPPPPGKRYDKDGNEIYPKPDESVLNNAGEELRRRYRKEQNMMQKAIKEQLFGTEEDKNRDKIVLGRQKADLEMRQSEEFEHELWTACQVHVVFHRGKAKEWKKRDKLLPKWMIAADPLRDLHNSSGDQRLFNILYDLNHSGMERSKDQKHFHHMFIISILHIIFGDEWGTAQERVMRDWGLTVIQTDVLIVTPRRLGKTTSVSIFIFVICQHLPGVIIGVFSTGNRASGGIMDRVLTLFSSRPDLLLRIVQHNKEDLFVAARPMPSGETKMGAVAKKMATEPSVCKIKFFPSVSHASVSNTTLLARSLILFLVYLMLLGTRPQVNNHAHEHSLIVLFNTKGGPPQHKQVSTVTEQRMTSRVRAVRWRCVRSVLSGKARFICWRWKISCHLLIT